MTTINITIHVDGEAKVNYGKGEAQPVSTVRDIAKSSEPQYRITELVFFGGTVANPTPVTNPNTLPNNAAFHLFGTVSTGTNVTVSQLSAILRTEPNGTPITCTITIGGAQTVGGVSYDFTVSFTPPQDVPFPNTRFLATVYYTRTPGQPVHHSESIDGAFVTP